MRRVALVAWLLALGAFADDLPRNPFWPKDYEGTRYPISEEPRFKAKPPEPEIDAATSTNEFGQAQQEAAEQSPKEDDPLEDPAWNDAVKALHFGATMGFSAKGRSQAAVMINGRVYAVGDLVSANVAEWRFTWKIESLSTDGKIKLKRITYRKIETNP